MSAAEQVKPKRRAKPIAPWILERRAFLRAEKKKADEERAKREAEERAAWEAKRDIWVQRLLRRARGSVQLGEPWYANDPIESGIADELTRSKAYPLRGDHVAARKPGVFAATWSEWATDFYRRRPDLRRKEFARHLAWLFGDCGAGLPLVHEGGRPFQVRGGDGSELVVRLLANCKSYRDALQREHDRSAS